ncbi:MAG: prepilin-type N-terminal cleavage/methylation domain-containing protein [Candidatus Saccharibacteria bacterium]|nr:MAG: prepilin-type N-terminal cleavage/methylation domain-containing protein [Candidatus Saccharibacteria bacterium]
MIHKRANQFRGFTIVELLIVVVVIAILAALVLVTYNSMQARASFSRSQSDLKSITKALSLYHVDNGSYPSTVGQPGCTNGWCGWDQVTGNSFIPGLSPQYAATLPQMPTELAANDTYLYQSNGTDYQLIRFRAAGLPTIETQNNPLLATTEGYNGLAWGYKTNSGGWW